MHIHFPACSSWSFFLGLYVSTPGSLVAVGADKGRHLEEEEEEEEMLCFSESDSEHVI